jgi:glutathione S-transferase
MVTLMLKLWGRVNSINVQKVLWVLDDLELDCERHDAGLHHGVNNTTDFLARNPNGRVPLLQDETSFVWESHAICRYLCNRQQALQVDPQAGGDASRPVAQSLYPADPLGRAWVDQWMDWTLWGISAPMVIVFQQYVRTPEDKRDLQKLSTAKDQSNDYLRVLEDHLAVSSYIASDHLTLADIALSPIVYRADSLGLEATKNKNIQRWITQLRLTKGYQKWVNVPMS